MEDDRAAIINGFNSIYKIIAQSRFVYRRRIFTVNGVYHQSRSLAAHVLKVKSHKLATRLVGASVIFRRTFKVYRL